MQDRPFFSPLGDSLDGHDTQKWVDMQGQIRVAATKDVIHGMRIELDTGLNIV
jgi:hypothetical protein